MYADACRRCAPTIERMQARWAILSTAISERAEILARVVRVRGTRLFRCASRRLDRSLTVWAVRRGYMHPRNLPPDLTNIARELKYDDDGFPIPPPSRLCRLTASLPPTTTARLLRLSEKLTAPVRHLVRQNANDEARGAGIVALVGFLLTLLFVVRLSQVGQEAASGSGNGLVFFEGIVDCLIVLPLTIWTALAVGRWGILHLQERDPDLWTRLTGEGESTISWEVFGEEQSGMLRQSAYLPPELLPAPDTDSDEPEGPRSYAIESPQEFDQAALDALFGISQSESLDREQTAV